MLKKKERISICVELFVKRFVKRKGQTLNNNIGKEIIIVNK